MRINPIWRPASGFSVRVNGSLCRGRDNRFKDDFWRPVYLLIISTLWTTNFALYAKAQKTNELCFEELMGNFLASDSRKYSAVIGFRTPGLNGVVDSTLGVPLSLRIDPPQVSFEKIDREKYTREVLVDVVFIDSTEQLRSLVWRDTIGRRDIGKVRRTKYPELKGTDPRWAARFLAPGIMLGAGIAGILSLFYIRSI